MKKFYILLALILSCFSLHAQPSHVGSAIRTLEQKEVKEVLEKDPSTLKKIWAPDFPVNSPFNNIEAGGKSTLDRPVMTRLEYLKFNRNIEKVLVTGDVVISMGNEFLIEKGKGGEAGNDQTAVYKRLDETQ